MSEQGILTMPAEAYHADPCDVPSLSASIAHLLCSKSARHAWAAHPKLNPGFQREENSRYDIGTAAHAILLEGADIVEVVLAPDWRTKAAQEARDAARAAGKIPLLPHVLADVQAMVAAAARQLHAIDADPPLFASGEPERTLIWEENGVVCRALIDWLHDDHSAIDDFKTTAASAEPLRWTRTLFQIGADIQTAFHLRGLRAITGSEAVMRYIVQETYPPYALSVVSLSPDALALADAKVEWAIKTWRECLATNEWPAYPSQVCYADLNAWDESRWMEKEAREAA